MIRNCRWLLIAIIALAGVAHAGARDRLDSFTRGLKGLEGRFTQHVFDEGGRVRETSSGRVALAAPRLFRWEYQDPYPQLIVADGTTVWVHDPDLEQVTRRPQGGAEQDSPLAALIDPARLDRDYIIDDEGEADGLQWLLLRPRKAGEDASFESARLGFGAQGLARMEIVDALGQRTEIRFSGWKRNPAFAAGTFRFTPPPGVDVVGEG
ncbi:outer membrane lipoprotein carrier protein [Luteimonas sp. J16]|jgi:outer membrane lipoprotein carrier protein|uniref:outer membrane lipoprotein chaperone LolA n=1 Tax=unclassified Luteimonas TaxID=2629088 RepID=UPI00047B1D31|nr:MULTISPECIES: outer membrane lipoprotein chaperone LolA [unclassified Luteimonas]TWG91842.1 outer membrane lipoprotein carrier protein [Luteimonas sp. J16]